MADKITLHCEFAPSPDKLGLRYTVTNGQPRAIYIFTPLREYRGQDFMPVPERAYVLLTNNGVLTVSKQLWQVPDHMDIYMPEVPYLTRIAAGARFEENLALKLPISVEYPYLRAGQPLGHTRRAARRDSSQAVFALGYISDIPGLKIQPVAGNASWFQIAYGDGIGRQKFVYSERVAVNVPVLVP